MANRESSKLLYTCLRLSLVCTAMAANWTDVKKESMVCVSGAGSDLLCTMQMENADRSNFNIDPLLQARYMSSNGTFRPWLEHAPSVFPDQELSITSSVGGFISGKTATATAYIDYLWCSEETCDTVLDLGFIKNGSNECQLGIPFAAFPNSIAGFGLPHSVGTNYTEKDFQMIDVDPPFVLASSITGYRRRCNINRDLQFLDAGKPLGAIHVTPVRSSAVFLSKETSHLMARTVKAPGTGICSTYIYPNSDFYASAKLFANMESCDVAASKQSFILETIADDEHKYIWRLDTSSIQPHVAAMGFDVASWTTANVDCRPLLGLGERNSTRGRYYNKQGEQVLEPANCTAELTDACRVRFNTSGAFDMVALNLTNGHMIGNVYRAPDGEAPTGWEWVTSAIPTLFYSLVHRLVEAEAVKPAACLAERVWIDGSAARCCDERQMEFNQTCANTFNQTGQWIPGNGIVFKENTLMYKPYIQNQRQYCDPSFVSETRDPMTTPEFLATYTKTRWATTTSLTGVHGYGVFDNSDELDPQSFRLNESYTKPWEVRITANLQLLEPEVAHQLQGKLTELLADTDSILRAPGAAFILVISLTTTVAGILQVVELESSIVRWHINWYIKALLRIMLMVVVSAVALMPVAFALAGERSTWENNRESGRVDYAQVWVRTQNKFSNNVLGRDGHKLVALVAFKTQYTVSFTAVGIVYVVTIVLCSAMLIACTIFVFVFGGKTRLHQRTDHYAKTESPSTTFPDTHPSSTQPTIPSL